MVKFTSREIRDILIYMLVIAGAFAYIFSGRNINIFFYLIPVTLVSVGLGFVLHELSHKFVAVHYGFYAEYKMWVQGLILALVTAYFGFVFAATRGSLHSRRIHIPGRKWKNIPGRTHDQRSSGIYFHGHSRFFPFFRPHIPYGHNGIYGQQFFGTFQPPTYWCV